VVVLLLLLLVVALLLLLVLVAVVWYQGPCEIDAYFCHPLPKSSCESPHHCLQHKTTMKTLLTC
jgi:hypothetical protein